MKIERTIVFGFEPAMEDMRNPMDSWDQSDSVFDGRAYPIRHTSAFKYAPELGCIGDADLKLAKKLIARGSSHRKFLREIIVWVRLTVPRYVWQEIDTYKVATVRNSCSTMHRLGSRDLVQEDFELDVPAPLLKHLNVMCADLRTEKAAQSYKGSVRDLRRELKNLLPEGYLQRAGYVISYEGLLKMYFDRSNHRLPEWRESSPGSICSWIKLLPYMGEFIEAVK